MKEYGLLPPKKDRRDLSREKVFGSVSLDSLPEDGLHRVFPPLRDQDGTFECTGYTATAMRGAKYKREFSPDWFVAQEAALMGYTGIFRGAGLRTQCKVIINPGCLPQEFAPYSWQKDGADYVANPAIWDSSLKEKALPFRASSFLRVDGSNDTFDNIRVALFMHDNDQEGVSAGMSWFSDWSFVENNGVLSMPTSNNSSPHNVRIYDWNKAGLIVEPHIGKVVIIPRKIINKYVYTTEGPYIFVDGTDTEALKAAQWGLLEKIKNWLVKWLAKLNNPSLPVPQIDFDLPAPIVTPEVPVSKYDWTNKQAITHSVRLICDEEGLTYDMKNKLCATINCESGFSLTAKNENKDSTGKVLSTDWGLCQFNDYWWVGAKKPFHSVSDILHNPEKCVRLMAREFKKGNAYLWVCYKKLF